MPRSRPASNPISYHRHTNQYYITRGGRRVYLGSDRIAALEKYHQLGLGLEPACRGTRPVMGMTVKELANRFIATQQANWRSPRTTLKSYSCWLGRFIKDHPNMRVNDFSVDRFAGWKMSLRKRGFAPESINHFLSAVRAIFCFAGEEGYVDHPPNLRRVKNERAHGADSKEKSLYAVESIRLLLQHADVQMRAMILLGLNCGFGPKDIHDLMWTDICDDRITLPRSKTGICQTYLLWPETREAVNEVKRQRLNHIARSAKRGAHRSDKGHVFMTRYWNPWLKDSVAEQFRKLCKKADVPCYGIYRLRHCASTAMSLVASPHVHRKFMRHSQLQQQVSYTHTPDAEVDSAVIKAKEKLLGTAFSTSDSERNLDREEVV